ncbi:hypothetical protein [Paenibacillus periandrae]|uniref:hypothetical protein n=1 Tax=Paenibacillus periandrae TaxID=1761741 RepID=UPI001F08C055|nr:hypothetical protein [Paenibacillus periandrae]
MAKNIDDSIILSIINDKKHLHLSGEEEDKKQVLQEYVDRVVIQQSTDINHFDAEIESVK